MKSRLKTFLPLVLVFFFILFSTLFFLGNTPIFSNLGSRVVSSESVEVGVATLSPRGESGGFIIPASCPSDPHFAGECSGLPTPPPTIDDVTISNPFVSADGTTRYDIVVTASESTGWTNIASERAMINAQGPSVGQYRGYLEWGFSSANIDSAIKAPGLIPCTRGGVAGIYNGTAEPTGYGSSYINLHSCEILATDADTLTATFNVSFNTNFTSPLGLNNNALSGWVSNNVALTAGWTEKMHFTVVPLPDLTASLSYFGQLAAGNTIAFTGTTQNAPGANTASNFYSQFTVQRDSDGATLFQFPTSQIGTLPGGSTDAQNAGWLIPTGNTAYSARFCADSTSVVSETDEANNCSAWIPLWVPPECNDSSFDNDSDVTADSTDRGCWTNPTNPATYNPADNSESSPPPDADLSAAPTQVRLDQTTIISWTVHDVFDCTVTGTNGDGVLPPWGNGQVGAAPQTFSQTTSPIKGTTVYTLSCRDMELNPIGDTIRITLKAKFEEF